MMVVFLPADSANAQTYNTYGTAQPYYYGVPAPHYQNYGNQQMTQKQLITFLQQQVAILQAQIQKGTTETMVVIQVVTRTHTVIRTILIKKW